MMTNLDHLTLYAPDGEPFLEDIVAGEESWAYHYTPESKRLSMERKPKFSHQKKIQGDTIREESARDSRALRYARDGTSGIS
ncbi:hypothetical protein Trydic_g17169 [Trypoxylus dichotomus]